MSDFTYVDTCLQPYAEDDTLLNDWLDNFIAHIKLRLFKKQEDWVHMAGEFGKGSIPKLKENAIDTIVEAAIDEFGWVLNYIVDRLITEYRLSNIDLDENTISELIFEFDEDGYEEWETECRKRIVEDYKNFMDKDKLIDYFSNLWKEGWRPQ